MNPAAAGSAVLLLHGQPGGAGDWDAVLAELDSSVQTVAVDRPGWHGRSSATGLAGNARAALAALDARGIARATVVGHSFGGAVAAWLAAWHPERVSALVLAAPAANVACLYELDRWLAAPIAGDLASATMLGAAGLVLTVEPLRRLLARELAIDTGYLGRSAPRLLRPTAWRAFVVEQRALIAELPELERHLDRIKAPTHVIAGSEDRIVPLSSLRTLCTQIPGAELILLDGAGHLLPVQRPAELAAVLRG